MVRSAAMEPLFHRFGSKPTELFLGTPHSILSSGSHRPLLFQLEDERGPAGLWVVKPQCRFPVGGPALLRELAGSDVAAWLGLPTPAVGLLRFPEQPIPTDSTEIGREAAAIYMEDRGRLAFCSRYIQTPRLEGNKLNRARKIGEQTLRDSIGLLAMDACIWHYDRTIKNPNALYWQSRLIPIDHDNAFFKIHAVDESGNLSVDYNAPVDADSLVQHIAFAVGRKQKDSPLWAEFAQRFAALDDLTMEDMIARWPDELDATRAGSMVGWKSDCARFLTRRRDIVAFIMDGIRRVMVLR